MSFPSESSQVVESLTDFHRAELDAVESATGRIVLDEALDILEGRSRLMFTRVHGLALFLYAMSFRDSCMERDAVIAKLLTSKFYESELLGQSILH